MTAILTEQDILRLKIRPRKADDVGNPVSVDPKNPENERRFSLGRHWVRIILSNHNQDVGCLVNGRKGTGKSNFGLSILWWCAELLAEHYGDDPRDRFNIDRCAVMDDEESIDLLRQGADKTNHPLTLLDDYGKTARARKWQSKTNEISNDIQDMNRTLNGITVMNTVDQNRIDKYQREIGGWYAESVPNMAAMDAGFVMMKIMIRVKNYRTKEEYFQYPFYDDCQVQRIAVKRAPKWLEEEYNQKRARNEEKSRRGTTETDEEPAQADSKEHSRLKGARKRAEAAQTEYDRFALMGMNHREILKEIDVAPSTWKYWISRGLVDSGTTTTKISPHKGTNHM